VLLHAEAIAVAACIRVGLHVLSFRRVASLACRPRVRRAARSDDIAPCVAAARRAAARVAYPTCLFESLIALAMLNRRGHAVALHLGARRTSGFEAHAWLTVDGRPVDGTADAAFVPLCCFPLGTAS
jgi:hypothetical protein